MSVRTGDRTEGKLQVLNLAMDLAAYTIQKCGKEDLFPKSKRWMLANRIANEAIEALMCIRDANSTLVDGIDIDLRHRHRSQKQIEAHGHLGTLYSLLELALRTTPGLGADKVEYWTQMVRNTDEKLKAWMQADQKMYLQKKSK